jgi:hypothetical protein
MKSGKARKRRAIREVFFAPGDEGIQGQADPAEVEGHWPKIGKSMRGGEKSGGFARIASVRLETRRPREIEEVGRDGDAKSVDVRTFASWPTAVRLDVAAESMFSIQGYWPPGKVVEVRRRRTSRRRKHKRRSDQHFRRDASPQGETLFALDAPALRTSSEDVRSSHEGPVQPLSSSAESRREVLTVEGLGICG